MGYKTSNTNLMLMRSCWNFSLELPQFRMSTNYNIRLNYDEIQRIDTINIMTANFEKAEQEAKNVLQANFIQDPPILAEQVARSYGLEVRYCYFKPECNNVAGFIDSKGFIIVNALESAARQNFTIAHELGHYLLGHLSNPQYGVLYRLPIGIPLTTPIEQEANCFAANLLVPADMLKTYIKRFPFANNRQLGNIFGVSSDVIGYRRQNLGL